MNQYKKLTGSFTFLILLIITVSCARRSDMVYFNKSESNKDSSAVVKPITIEKGDILDIRISSLSQESNSLFNQPPTNNTNSGYTTGNAVTTGYSVNEKGSIQLPLLGEVVAEKLTIEELRQLINTKLTAYVSNPTVVIRIANFKVTVLGDVARPGTFTIPNELFTITQALGVAGDLNITAKRTDILVLRTINGKVVKKHYDLTQSNNFQSDVFYLKQNDVIYVEPNSFKNNTSRYSPFYSSFLSVAALILTTVSVVVNLNK